MAPGVGHVSVGTVGHSRTYRTGTDTIVILTDTTVKLTDAIFILTDEATVTLTDAIFILTDITHRYNIPNHSLQCSAVVTLTNKMFTDTITIFLLTDKTLVHLCIAGFYQNKERK